MLGMILSGIGFFRFALRGHVPFLPVIQNRVFAPYLLRRFASYSHKEICGARPGPVPPFVNVAVMNWIVVDVIHGRPEMTIRIDRAVKAVMPDLPPAALVFAGAGVSRDGMVNEPSRLKSVL